MIQHFVRALCAVILCLSLSGCFIKPYRFKVTQGNDLSAEQIAQLHVGMSEEEVRYLLGTPLLNDAFHNYRWDYFYMEKPPYGQEMRRHLTIFFRHGRVERIEQEISPSL